MGYMYMPEATVAAFDSLGFLLSGDVAEFDDNDLGDVPPPSGFMKITGRIKELIITAGGENIPPVLIESAMKVAMPARVVHVQTQKHAGGEEPPMSRFLGTALETIDFLFVSEQNQESLRSQSIRTL